MVTLAALRQPARAARIARALWVLWAVIVWNVVLDHVIVVAGRRFIAAAQLAAVNMDAWMRPAVARGLWLATASASVILFVGLVCIHRATRA
jgi:hypothetical protein